MASIWQNLLNSISNKNQNTNIDYNKAIYNYLGDKIVWNPEKDETYINKGYRYNSTIYSIVNLINKAASTIPFQVYEVQNNNDLKRYKAMTSGELNTSVLSKSERLKKSSLVELDGTEIHQLLERPNPAQSFSAFLQEIIAFGKLTGNRYIYGITPETGLGAGKFKELYVLPSQVIEINSGGLMKPVKDYSLEYNGSHKIPAEQILHIKDFNPYYDGTGSHLYGMSPLKAGLRSMSANNEALTTGVKYLQNQTARGVLMSDEGDLTETQAKALKQKFKNQYQGSENAGDVIITPKKLSWVNFGLNASDLSLLEQYDSSIKDLCNIYNVPVQLLNNTSASTYNNQKEAKKALYQNAVIPELIKVRDELNRWLAPQFGEKLFIDFDFTVIPELQEEMDKVVGQMSQAWWLTPNEKREATGFGVDDENPEMDKYYVPANLIPVTGQELEIPEDLKEVNIDYFDLLKTEVVGSKDMYTTIQEAKDRAAQLGGAGYHSHIFRGGTVYMPFETHEAYEAAITGKLEEYYEDQALEGKDPIEQESYIEQDSMIEKASYNDYPQSATNNARRMIEWREKYGRDEVKGGTAIGWQRASSLSKREKLSEDTIARMAQFNRHRKNSTVDPKYKDTPWKDNGYVAWNLWGGTSGVDWAINKMKKLRGE